MDFRVKRSIFILIWILNFSIHFRSTSLVKTNIFVNKFYSFKKIKWSKTVYICGCNWFSKLDAKTLCCKIVYFVRSVFSDYTIHIHGICYV